MTDIVMKLLYCWEYFSNK